MARRGTATHIAATKLHVLAQPGRVGRPQTIVIPHLCSPLTWWEGSKDRPTVHAAS